MNGATIKAEKGRSIFYTNLYIAILVLFILILLRRDHNMTAIGNATAFLLLVGSALLPLLLIYYQQQEEERKAAAQKEKEKHVKSAVAMVAEVALKARRQLERGEEEDNAAPIKRRRRSRFQHDREKLAIQEDYFSPTPIFNDRQFERTFRITKSMVEEILQICANADPFFTALQDVTGRFAIAPVAKILMALKQIAYGCCPAAFMDYFQMSETTGRLCLIKFSRLVSSHEALRSVYLRQMT